MNLNSKAIFLAVFFLTTLGANATVTLNINADLLQTATAGTAAPSTGLVMLVANTSTTVAGNFGSTSILENAPLTVGSSIMPGDVILKTWTLGTGSSNTPGAFYDTASGLNMSSFGATTGNPLALLWFPTLTTAATTATASTPYGIYTGPGSNGSASWVLPSDSQLVTLNMFTSNAALTPGGTLPSSAGVASFTVAAAPEPSRVILAALGMSLTFMRRRRR